MRIPVKAIAETAIIAGGLVDKFTSVSAALPVFIGGLWASTALGTAGMALIVVGKHLYGRAEQGDSTQAAAYRQSFNKASNYYLARQGLSTAFTTASLALFGYAAISWGHTPPAPDYIEPVLSRAYDLSVLFGVAGGLMGLSSRKPAKDIYASALAIDRECQKNVPPPPSGAGKSSPG